MVTVNLIHDATLDYKALDVQAGDMASMIYAELGRIDDESELNWLIGVGAMIFDSTLAGIRREFKIKDLTLYLTLYSKS